MKQALTRGGILAVVSAGIAPQEDHQELDASALAASADGGEEQAGAAPEPGAEGTQVSSDDKNGEVEVNSDDADAASAKAEIDGDLTAKIDLLKETLEEKDSKILKMGVEIEGLKTEAGKLSEVVAPLEDIVRASVSAMAVALGHSAPDLQNVSGGDLVSRYSEVKTEFGVSFKVGGIAQGADSDEASETHEPSAYDKAKVSSIRRIK